MKSVRLIKIEDNTFKGKHPKNILVGFIAEGMLLQEPLVGYSCCVNDFCTSRVEEIIDDNTFRTLNSVYKIEILGEIKIKEYRFDKKKDKIEVTDMFNRSFKINVK